MNNTLKTIVWITAGVAVVSLGIAAAIFFAGGMQAFWEPGNGISVDEQRSVSIGGIEHIDVNTSSTDVYVSESIAQPIEPVWYEGY